jgi:hypothetical protein
MIRIETREYVKSIVEEYTEGISLSKLHAQLHRTVTRLQLRTVLTALYKNERISRERVHENSRRITKYYPFNGTAPVTRKRKKVRQRDKKMLSMKDFMPGKKYQAFIEQ